MKDEKASPRLKNPSRFDSPPANCFSAVMVSQTGGMIH
jgi:hypothetical protein